MLNVAILLVVAPINWNLTLGGDVMLYHISSKTNPMAAISKLTKSADVCILNLEIPLTSASVATTRKTPAELKAKTQFILKADPYHIHHLADLGVDAVSLGTNHTMDYGSNGLDEMTGLLDRFRIARSGAGDNLALAQKPAFFRTPGSPRIALSSWLAFVGAKSQWRNTPATSSTAGVAVMPLYSESAKVKRKIAAIVQNAKLHSDYVAIALHGGIERMTVPTSYQVRLARAFIDAGADLVVGHHPHVLQGAELYHGKPILYSIGNFINSLPGDAALFHLRYSGTKLVRFSITPYTIAKGRIILKTAKASKMARRQFRGLSQAIQTKFPNRRSKLLSSSYSS
jgi:poly-gamma-glutamate synthesis protein (capsule biosynthesis protein)